MSTDHQKYSTENQAEAIRQYADRRGLEIVRTYADEGKSGLRLDGRDALKQLIEDVQTGKADFTTILVYDVSRWGRFQDADESAYYEYICTRRHQVKPSLRRGLFVIIKIVSYRL
jgi:DNA invertase Pin-like site-specific DNA recombinase